MTALLVILLAALVFAQVSRKFNLPWVIALIAGGIFLIAKTPQKWQD